MKLKGKKKVILFSILTSLISIPTIISSISTTVNNQNNILLNSNNLNKTRTVRGATLPDSDIKNLYASEIKYNIDELNKNASTHEGQLNLKNYLVKIFPSLSSLPASQEIKRLRVTADSMSGYLYIHFVIYQGTKIIGQMANEFTLDKKGITSVVTNSYTDNTNTYDDIKLKLESFDLSYFVGNGIIPVVATSPASTINYQISEDTTKKQFTLSNIVINNAIGDDTLLTLDVPSTITIFATKNSHEPTSAKINYDYLNDPQFTSANTAQAFYDLLNGNKTNTSIINKVVSFDSLPADAVKSIDSVELVAPQNKSVKVIFNVTKYYDEYGVEQTPPSGKKYEFTYNAFPYNTNYTIVKNNIGVTGKDFAYQYTSNDLIDFLNNDINGAKKYILNPVEGSSVTSVAIRDVNNRTGVISAVITLSKAYDKDGNILLNKNFEGISFNVPKTVNEPTNIIRNTTKVDESLKQVDEMLAQNDPTTIKQWVEKYTDIISPAIDPFASVITNVNVEKNTQSTYSSSSIVTNTLYKATITLTNFIKNDEKLSLSNSTQNYVVYINVGAQKATKLIDSVYSTGINADTTIANFIPSDLVDSTSNEYTVKAWIVQKANENSIFENYFPNMNVSNITSYHVEKVDGSNNSVKVTITINNAILVDGSVGNETFSFKINNLQSEQERTTGGTVDIADLTIDGVNADTYTIDIVNSSTMMSAIKTAINQFANIDKFFVNAPNEQQINNKPIINPSRLPSFNYNDDKLIIIGSFLSRQKNPASYATYENMTITIAGFNKNNTTVNSPIDISSVSSLTNLDVNSPSLIRELQSYIWGKGKNNIFVNAPIEMVPSSTVGISSRNPEEGTCDVVIHVTNAKIDLSGTNKGFGDKTFTVKFTGFVQRVKETTGKTVTVNEASSYGLTGINTNDFAFDFKYQYANAFIQLLNNAKNDQTKLDNWFNNAPTIDRIKSEGKEVIKPDSIANFGYRTSLINGENAVSITGEFISWDLSLDKRQPLIYKYQTITIKGFSKKNTITSPDASIDVSNIPGLDLDPTKISTEDAMDKLNNNKDIVKAFLSSKVNDLKGLLENPTFTLGDKLNATIEQGDFYFEIKDGELYLNISDVPFSSSNGLVEEHRNLSIKVSNKFNSSSINSSWIEKTINWDSELYKLSFGDNTSPYSYDWKYENSENQLKNILDTFKTNITNNLSKFISTNSIDETLLRNISITSIDASSPSNLEFFKKVESNKIILTVNYQGYVKGTLKSITQNIVVNLKATLTESEIANKIQDMFNDKYSEKELIDSSNFQDYIDKNGQQIANDIYDILKNNLPQNIEIKVKDNNGDYIPFDPNNDSWKDIFELNDNKNGIVIKNDAIQIIGKDKNLPLDITLPNSDTGKIEILSYEIKSPWSNITIYLIYSILILLIILIILIYELIFKKRRKKIEKIAEEKNKDAK